MKRLAKRITNRIIEILPLCAYRLALRRGVLGINYHVVSDEHLAHIKHVLPYKSTKMFEDDLLYLKQSYDLISYQQAIESHHYPRAKSVGNSIILTFDDGYSECFSVVRPLLMKHDIPCVFFVISDVIDNRFMFYRNKVSLCIERVKTLEDAGLMDVLRIINGRFEQRIETRASFIQWMASLQFLDSNILDEVCKILRVDIEKYLVNYRPYLTSNQIRQLISDGFTIGAHSKRHPYLYTLSGRDEIEEEIVGSCRIIKDLTGQDYVPFAFPFSADHLNRDFLEDLVRKHDFIGLLFDARELQKDRGFIVNRIWVDPPASISGGRSNIPRLLHDAYQCRIRQRFPRLLNTA